MTKFIRFPSEELLNPPRYLRSPGKAVFWSTFAVLMLLFTDRLFAQAPVRGKIMEESGKPVPYASVLLLSPADSLFILGTVSDENGQFEFDPVPENRYLLSVSKVGLKKHFQEVALSGGIRNLDTITLYELDNDLEEVVVSAQKPLYEKQMDRMVVNVRQSITAAGSTVLQVLQKSPGVTVNRQNNTMMLNGKTGVAVMINNKISGLPLDAVVQMLDGLSAANVERIELITSPPSRYDAEGTAGIIHIVMQDHPDLGTNGNFGFTAGMTGKETLGTNFNLNHRRENFLFFTDYSIRYDRSIQHWDNELVMEKQDFTSRFYSSSERLPRTSVQNFRIGSEFQIRPKTKIGTLVTLYQRHWNMKALTSAVNTITPDSSRNADIDVRELNRWQSLTANINLTHSIDDKNSFRLDLDYLKFHNKNPSSYRNSFYYPNRNLSADMLIAIEKDTPINIKVAKVDYTFRPATSFIIEAGIKGTISEFFNEVEVINTEDGVSMRDAELSVSANLEERIAAAYASVEWKINDANQLNGGIRYEHTDTYISTAREDGVVDRNSGNLFPSLIYQRAVTEHFDIVLGYSKRITRPTFNDMAPFVFMADPNTYFSGNPALKPALIDGIKLDFKIKQATISLDYSNSRNRIVNFQPEVDLLTNKQVLQSRNLDFEKLYSVNLSVPWILTDWWDIQVNTSGFYRKFKTIHLEKNTTRDLSHFNFNVVNNIVLPKDFSLELSGFYESKMIWGLWEFEPFGAVNIGLQKKLKENKGVFRLSVDDVFRTNIWRMHSFIPETRVKSYLYGDLHNQSIRLNYTRSFGNKKLKAVNIESGSEEERKRVQ